MDWQYICHVFVTVTVLLSVAKGQDDNTPPTWDENAVLAILSAVSEDTPVGTPLGNLICNDVDGDRIGYQLDSGSAVRVGVFGDVTLSVLLDFENQDDISYDLEFSCYDVDANGNQIHNPVPFRTIIVPVDANDNAPVFSIDSREGYSFRVDEFVAIGTTLTPALTITDEDRASNAVIEELYFICNSPIAAERENLTTSNLATCSKFSINLEQNNEGEYFANLTVIATLDYEERQVYSSQLVAVDGTGSVSPRLTTTVNVQINVQDAQDLPPYFTNEDASASVSEAAQKGTIVSDFFISARDGDLGSSRPVTIEIIEDALNAFTISDSVEVLSGNEGTDVYRAYIMVNNSLDREAIPTSYEFVVKVTENEELNDGTLIPQPDATATATYSVFVTDANDNAPTFSQDPYYVNVTELDGIDSAVQISGFRIDCNDPDEPTNARYRVDIIDHSFSNTVPNLYSVTPNLDLTGSASLFLQVEQTAYLDYDIPEQREQYVVLRATEVGTAELLSGTTTISISLRDINDNEPIFTQPSGYRATISENVDTFPYNFLTLTATDKDSGPNGEIEYRLEGETGSLFSIDSSTGQMYLNGPVDYEDTAQYVFFAFAKDNGEIPAENQVPITVEILNFNDEGPTFLLPSYQTSIEENTLNFFNAIVVTAVDDEDGTVLITYRIVAGQSPNNAFSIDPNTGTLSLLAPLDYEETPLTNDGLNSGQFELIVEASDNGNPAQTNQVSILVTVIDQNDHVPVMDPIVYSVDLSELAEPGQFIEQIKATDDDSGSFGTLTYRIGQGLSDNFFIDPDTGVLSVGLNRNFNYNLEPKYTLQVIAADGGSPQETATGSVYITMIDGNNQQPVFDFLIYNLEVDEKRAVGDVIRTIQATDTDSTQELVYSIIQSTIRALDTDGRTLSATSAYDYVNAFGVNDDGGIYVKSQLDRDAANEISFTLQAEDINTEEGPSTATTQITILILGEPNTNITFDLISTIYMNEDVLPEYNVITVVARDPNNNAVSNYRKLDQQSNTDKFLVRDNGQIYLSSPINYELDDIASHLHLVVVEATSTDGQSATITATISIVDVNDNNPVFQNVESFKADVPETYTYPMEVFTVIATDADSRSYGPLEISISGGLSSEDFQIFQEEPSTGGTTSRRAAVIVAPNVILDYNRRSEYYLDLVVVDNAATEFSQDRKTSIAQLIITVIDENNKTPEFLESSRTLSAPETADIGTSLGTIIATDQDTGNNGIISYSLLSTDQSDSVDGLNLFTISSSTGTVRVAQTLLGLGGKRYEFQVRARDNGEPPNTSYMDLIISVQSTEDNDGTPSWLSPANGYIVYAPEETPDYVLRDALGVTTFFDVTPRTGTAIQYALSDASDYAQSFRINSVTGEITIIDSLDREQQESYTLLIYAEDISDPDNLRSGRQLIVQLTDADDNGPTFTNPRGYDSCQAIDRPLVIYVAENTLANISISFVQACDPDVGDAGIVMYSLYNDVPYCAEGNAESIFSLDPLTGELETRETVDYEVSREYIMCVEATPGSSSSVGKRKKRSFDLAQVDQSLDNVAYIQIVIIDLNDNAPFFPDNTPTAYVRTQPSSGPVITLSAVDRDGPDNSVILYRVTSSVFVPASGVQQAASDVFSLRGDSGALYPDLASYLEFAGGHFVLTVQAIDRQNPAFYDEATITIHVYEDGQAIKLILEDEAAVAVQYSSQLIDELNSVSDDYSFLYLQVSEHTTDDGIEPDKTDVCFLVVDEDDNYILDIREAINVLDRGSYRVVLGSDPYNVLDRGRCFPTQSSADDVRWRNLWWVLVAVAIFIFICCIILIILVVMLYRKYKRYMETQETYLVGQ